MALTTVDLYRGGNNTRARLDSLRNRDVSIYTDIAQNEVCLRASSTNGVSCYDSAAAAAAVVTGKIWHLPRNSTYDDAKLVLFLDQPIGIGRRRAICSGQSSSLRLELYRLNSSD
jgi:hypothetical protein